MKTAQLCAHLRAPRLPKGMTLDRLMCEAADELDRYVAWVDDLQAGMYVNCVYCGHRYGPGETTPVSMADALKAHIAACPQHPMAGIVTALTDLCDAWDSGDGGKFKGSITKAHAAGRAALAAAK